MNPDRRALESGGRGDERGSAVVVSLLLMTLFLILGGAFLSTSLTDSLIAGNQVSATRAFQLAEAGVAHGMALVDKSTIDAALSGDGVLLDGEPLGNGSYSVRVVNNVPPLFPMAGIDTDAAGPAVDGDGFVVLTSTGRFRHATSTVRVVLYGREQPWSRWGVFGASFLSAHGSGTVTGPIGSNNNMYLSSDIIGDATAGGTIDYPERVSGTVTEFAPRVRFQGTVCPVGEYGPAPSGPGVSFGPISGDLRIEGGADVVLPAGTYYFNKLIKTGTGRLRIPEGDVVQIYVKSEVFVEGTGIDNENDAADHLFLFGCAENAGMLGAAPEWRIAPTTTLHATIYSPSHRLRLYGEGAKIGSFITKQFTKFGSGPVVHDPTISGTTGGGYEIVRGTWTTP